MARPSKLTPEQWLEIERRHVVAGESIASICREYGIDESTARKRVRTSKAERAKGVPTLRGLATKKMQAAAALADVNTEIAALPVVKQILVDDLVQQMRTISGHLAGAAEYSASTARRLAGIANGMVMTIDPARPDAGKLRQVGALTDLSNNASALGVRLIAANRDSAPPPPPVDRITDLTDEELAAELAQYGIKSS